MSAPAADAGHDDTSLRSERYWARVVGLIVGLLVLMMIGVSLHWAAMPTPLRVETVDPRTLHLRGEFVESNLGTAVDPDGRIVVRLIAQQYSFFPPCIVVPAGLPVTFRATAADAIHGFIVGTTNANAMLVPGFISTFTTTFRTLGDQLMPCHEYCGAGHEAMWARVRVLSPDEFMAQSAPGRRLNCVAR